MTPTSISPATTAKLRGYLDGRLSLSEMLIWFTSLQGDLEIEPLEQDLVARLLLLLEECGEGLRSAEDVKIAATEALLMTGSISLSTGSEVVTFGGETAFQVKTESYAA